MKEQFPAKETESKSPNYSRQEEWEAKDLVLAFPLFPLFIFAFLFDDLF